MAAYPLDADITPFLKKLLTLTSTVSSDIAGWDENGSVFIITDGKEFEKLLRNYFKGTQQTFIRQLHFYGFSKSDLPKLGSHAWSFSHPCFLRDSPCLAVQIKRKGHKQSAIRTSGMPLLENESECNVKDQLDEIKDLRVQVQNLQNTTNQLIALIDTNIGPSALPNKKQRTSRMSSVDSTISAGSTSSSRSSMSASDNDDNQQIEKKMSGLNFQGFSLIEPPEEETVERQQAPPSTNLKLKRSCSSLELLKDLANGFDDDDVEMPSLFSLQ